MNKFVPLDPVALTSELVRCQSVTPIEGGALALLENVLTSAGFKCVRVDRNEVPNLFAKFESEKTSPVFGFNGHTDVVPTGTPEEWNHDPFGGEIVDGWLWGRGSADMKSGVAAFVAASIDFVRANPNAGTIIITITGDEEADAVDGTTAILDWMRVNKEKMDVCLVGEPTCPNTLGEMIKIGRRGSLTAKFHAHGTQGHSAYPHRACNPVAAIANLANRLTETVLDEGSENFSPTTLVVTNIDTGNTANNVIPGHCQATVNIRFNDLHTSASLIEWLQSEAKATSANFNVAIETKVKVTAECFLTPKGELSDLVARIVQQETGQQPVLSTSGGTSDARFIKSICPVVEFGLVSKTIHQVDERVNINDIVLLKEIYLKVLREYFA